MGGLPSPPPTRIHGTLVEVAGVGVLLLGRSGIGKSECAIELVLRGFRFVADDVVLLRPAPHSESCISGGQPGETKQRATARLVGEGPELVRHHVELRGIGIVHVPSLFGQRCVADSAPVDLVVELEPWGAGEVERIGLDRQVHELAGVEIPSVRLPVAPGRNVATLVEVAAREFRRRQLGPTAATLLDERLGHTLGGGDG